MYNLITIGDCVIDTHILIDNATVNCDINHEHCHLCLDYAAKIPIVGSFQSLGGNAANVACGVSKLGLNSAIISSIGNDANGRLAKQGLKKSKVKTKFVYADKKIATRYSVVLNFKGERTILSFHQKRNYIWPKKMPRTDWVYYTGLSEGFEKTQEKLIEYLGKHPAVRLAFNPGSYQLKYALNSVREMLVYSDILIINLEEAEQILDATLGKEKTPQNLIRKLLTFGVEEVVLTDAARGAWAGNNEEIWKIESFPVKVVAKTGAGDAFSSGYISAKSYGKSMPEALGWGIANSCSIIQNFGVQEGLLDKKDIKKMLTKYVNIKPKLV